MWSAWCQRHPWCQGEASPWIVRPLHFERLIALASTVGSQGRQGLLVAASGPPQVSNALGFASARSEPMHTGLVRNTGRRLCLDWDSSCMQTSPGNTLLGTEFSFPRIPLGFPQAKRTKKNASSPDGCAGRLQNICGLCMPESQESKRQRDKHFSGLQARIALFARAEKGGNRWEGER